MLRTHTSVHHSVVMESWMANCNMTAVTACPETKPIVHKNICFLGMSFTFTKGGRVASCSINSKQIRDFNGF